MQVETKGDQMKWVKRLFGICATRLPADPDAWQADGGTVRIDLVRMPELKPTGSGVRLEGDGLDPRLLVFHGDDDQYYAVANRCTHMGRRIDTIGGSGTIQCCSVSKSTFTYDGRPVSGAAQKPLTTYPVSREGDILTINV